MIGAERQSAGSGEVDCGGRAECASGIRVQISVIDVQHGAGDEARGRGSERHGAGAAERHSAGRAAVVSAPSVSVPRALPPLVLLATLNVTLPPSDTEPSVRP